MNRREAILKTTVALGYAVSLPSMSAVLNGCTAKPELNYQPVFFSDEQAALAGEIAEAILPRTDTPGAKEAGVPAFIDRLIDQVYSKEDQQDFLNGLTDFDKAAEEKYSNRFVDCTAEEKLELVKRLNEEATKDATGSSEGWWAATASAERPFILKIKELTLLGFFTSEPGATQVLQYNQVPGPYKGCVPLADAGKAWAT